MEIFEAALDSNGEALVPYALENITALMERLGDSKDQVRSAALALTMKLIAAPGSAAQLVLDRMISGFQSKAIFVRINLMELVQQILRE